MSETRVSDIVVPENFTNYIQQHTEQKSRLVQSGAMVLNGVLNEFLAGGGLSINIPSFRDLADDADNVSDDVTGNSSTANKIETGQEIAVRLSRNSSWSSMDLTAALAGPDPLAAIEALVGDYWVRRLQDVFVATMGGIFLDNDTATDAFHVQFDLTHDISGGAFIAGVTDFSAEAMIQALLTSGDSLENLRMIMMHSTVYGKLLTNDLIDFIKDSTGTTLIPTFLGREVIVDDGLPSPSAGIFETWVFGANAVQWGQGSPKVPTETDRDPEKGNGGGQETLFNRVEWAMHPEGHQFNAASTAIGGPGNGTGVNNLNHADSWQRVFTERKQIKIARLISRES